MTDLASLDGREVYAFLPASLQERITACFGREATSGLEECENTGIAGRVWGCPVHRGERVWCGETYDIEKACSMSFSNYGVLTPGFHLLGVQIRTST